MDAPNSPREFVERLRLELPRLLREDVEVRGQIIALLSDYLTTRQGTAAILGKLRQMREDFDLRMDELSRRLEEQGRRLEEHSRRLEEHSRRIEEHSRTLGAIGARWGMMTEEAFRRSVRGPFADQAEIRVEHWRHHDTARKVLGYPADVDMDVVVRNGTVVVIEIRSSLSGADVAEFGRRVQLYREVTGRDLTRMVIIGAYVDDRAREVAGRLGIEVVSCHADDDLSGFPTAIGLSAARNIQGSLLRPLLYGAPDGFLPVAPRGARLLQVRYRWVVHATVIVCRG